MYLHLERAWIDDYLIHDADDPSLTPHQLTYANRTVAPRRVTSERAQRHGIVDRTKLWGGQVVALRGATRGTDDEVADAYDELRARLMLDVSHVFMFRRRGMSENEQVEVVAADSWESPAEGYSRWATWSIGLSGADPRMYSAALRSATYDPTSAMSGGGVSMPLDFSGGGLEFSTTTATQLTARNDGNYRTPPRFVITGPVVNPIVDNDTTGESIYVPYTLGDNDTIEVDVALTRVTLNGADRPDLFDAAQSVWFELVKGENALRLRGAGAVTGKTSLTAYWRDARI